MAAITVRLTPEMEKSLETFALLQDRSKAYVAEQALQEYLEKHAWQLAEIQAGIDDARAGRFAPDAKVQAVFSKYIQK